MVMNFSNSRLPGPPSEWIAFLRAIVAATAEDETDALEFKSSCNLVDHEEVGKSIARTILAMANRNPDAAQREYAGAGLLVVGIAPGQVHGITKVDPTHLGDIVANYVGVGEGAPIWHLQYWDLDAETVLVIDVHPPRWGDPPFKLRKGWGTVSKGTVFVRRNASSPPATHDEMAMLARREHSKPGKQSLPVSIRGGAEVLPRLWLNDALIDRWVTNVVQQLLDSISAPPAPPPTTPRTSGLTGMPFVSNHRQVAEDRSEEDFRAEVADYERAVREVIASLPVSLGVHLVPAPELVLQNDSDRYFAELEIEFLLPPGVLAAEPPDAPLDFTLVLPPRPRRFGPWWKRTDTLGNFSNLATDLMRGYQVPGVSFTPHIYGTDIENDGHGPVVSRIRELRSTRSLQVATDVMFLVPRSYEGTVTIEWSATAKDVDAKATGSIAFTLGEPIDLFTHLMEEMQRAWENQ